jgi:hypothetical protein
VWDDFGIQQAKMIGFWDAHCPAQTGRKDVLATAYVKNGRALIAVASWATNEVAVHLQIDGAAMGFDPSKMNLYAPAIQGFQPETQFKPGEEIPVQPGKGWLLLTGPQRRQQ